MPLTALQISKAEPRQRPYKLYDQKGLFLLVHHNGSKYWRFKYRFDGKEKLLALGVFPEVSLAQAREHCREARATIKAGQDPSQLRQQDKINRHIAHDNTFADLATAYLDKLEKEGRAPATMKKNRWLLGMAINHLGSLPIAEIGPPMILSLLKQIENKGTVETAHRLRTTIGSVFRYAAASGIVENDPTALLQGALVQRSVQHRAAITDPEELGALLRAIRGFQGQPTTRIALQLLIIFATRPGELRLAKWTEFDWEKRVWNIPADRMKMRKPHKVPLTDQAILILNELRELTGYCEYLFPSIRSPQRPISENTLNAALRNMGYDKSQVSAHGFRATFSTIANESGRWNPDVIERALAHQEPNEIRRAYARAEHWNQRVKLADWWSDYLTKLEEQNNE